MSYLSAEPEVIAAAAAHIDGIGSAIDAAHRAVAGPTSGLAAAAADEVSTTIAKLFGEYGQAFQSVIPQAAKFHSDFNRALTAAAAAYSGAETAASNALRGAAGAATTAVPAAATNVNAIVLSGTGNPIPSPNFMTALLKYLPAGE